MSDNSIQPLTQLELYFDCEMCGAPQVIVIYIESADPELVAGYMSQVVTPMCYSCFLDTQAALHDYGASSQESDNGLRD